MADPEAEQVTWTHIGDGVYARWDGYHVWLSLQNQEPRPCSVGIALDAQALDGLMKFVSRQVGGE